ncbi:glycosyltransferase family 39 protein [Methanobrevibacter sp.]
MFVNDLIYDLNLRKEDKIYLTVLLLFSLIVTVISINNNMNVGLKSDVLVYLTNALIYSGLNENIHNTSTLYLSPVICFLTGILFRFGLGKESIFIVTGIFSILANLSIYILLKYRYNRLLSLFGAVLFGSFNLILTYWADGTLDVPVISVSIWVIIFLILAVYENPKYYLLCFPLAVLSIFTRYSALFMLPLVLLYFLSKNDFFNVVDTFLYDRREFVQMALNYIKGKEFRYILLGIIIGVLLFILICVFISSLGSGLTFFTQISESVGGFDNEYKYIRTPGYSENSAFYIYNFLYMMNFDSIDIFGVNFAQILMIFIIIAVAIHIINFMTNYDSVKTIVAHRKKFKVENFEKYLIILLIALGVLFIFSLTVNHLLANIFMLTAMVVIFSLLEKLPIGKKFYSMNFLCIAWFSVYFIFFSMINIKSYRYLISCIPPLVYFSVWAIDCISQTILNGLENQDSFIYRITRNPTFEFENKRRHRYLKIILILAIAILMAHAFTFESDYKFSKINDSLDEVCYFIKTHDSEYMDKTITTDNEYCMRYATWYLHTDVKLNSSVFYGTPTDDYILTNHFVQHKDLKRIQTSGNVRLYELKPDVV